MQNHIFLKITQVLAIWFFFMPGIMIFERFLFCRLVSFQRKLNNNPIAQTHTHTQSQETKTTKHIAMHLSPSQIFPLAGNEMRFFFVIFVRAANLFLFIYFA